MPPTTVDAFEFHRVRVSARGSWLFVRLRAGKGLIGLGEASHGFGFSRASDEDDARMEALLRRHYALVEGHSPFDLEAFRQAAWEPAKAAGLAAVTAYSAIEQAMADLAARAAGVPLSSLLGGRLRERVPVYANINRATNERSPEGFAANAELAVSEGFRAIKAAPFDDYPGGPADDDEKKRLLELGIRRIEAIRAAIGPETRLLIDCHSRFDRALSIVVARRLDAVNLYWYEEPLDPGQLEDTLAVKSAINQRMAGGEILFGREGFERICRENAVDVIMPDVKHCGGVAEARKIAALAEVYNVEVSPHNPSGPVSMAASAQVSAGLPNFELLEHAWGEAPWRAELLDPPERFENGDLVLNDLPGLGTDLNDRLLAQYA